MYGFTHSGASAARFYWESPGNSCAGPRFDLPVAVSVFPPRDLPGAAELGGANLIHFNELPRGCHFAAME